MKIYLNTEDLLRLLKEKYPECEVFDLYCIDKGKEEHQLHPSCRTEFTMQINGERILIEPHNIKNYEN